MKQSSPGNRTRIKRSLLRWSVLCFSVIVAGPRPSEAQSTGAYRPASHSAPAASAALPTDLGSLIRSGWVQVVRFENPIGATIEIASGSGLVSVPVPGQVGLALGQTYRLRVSAIPDKPNVIVYPTIRLIGYVMPPAQVDPVEYPIPIHFLDRDFADAAEGRLVSNVVFLEDPVSAVPLKYPAGELPIVDIAPNDDALKRASSLGRPVVFIQLGNRVPLDGRIENGPGNPPVYMIPASLRTHAVGATMGIMPASGQNHAVTAHACGPAAGSQASRPACCLKDSVIRLPYKVHPRMPHDEYLCDGGDEIPYAHFTAYDTITAVGAGEAVAQFSRPGERPRLVASNQVCVYAPRFGLVRSSAVSIAEHHLDGPRGVDHRLRRASVENRISPDQRTQKDKTLALRRREQLGSVAMREPLGALDELRMIAAVYRDEGSDRVFGQIGTGKLGQSDEARIAMTLQTAKAWSRDQYPMYTAIKEGGGQITGTLQTGEIQQIKQPFRKPGDLLIWKTVSVQNARQGDVIEFAIYYRNTGQRSIENVSIIDSLTTRLEYVPDSAKTDRRAIFTAAQNDVESSELRWDISDPVPAGQQGVVWFQAQVR